MTRSLTATRTILAAAAFTCARACQPPNCDNADHGSCGNACCKLNIIVSGPASNPPRSADVMTALNETLAHGGPDGRYSFPKLAGGGFGFSDLRPYNLSVDFIGQTHHLTYKRQFTDTQDYTISSTTYQGAPAVAIKAFSISQIGGAYGDAGQNYKNLYEGCVFGLAKSTAARLYLWHFHVENADDSCPPPAPKKKL